MDRAEAALLIAEKALQEARRLTEVVIRLQAKQPETGTFVIDEQGYLVHLSAVGEAKQIGRVRGLDGQQGPPGPAKDGKDGLDGLGFDDVSIEYDGERTIIVRFMQGDRVKECGRLVLPIVIYRGTFKQGETYQRGDMVSWGGQVWHAHAETDEKPDTSQKWQLAVRRGRDGKDGLPGAKGDVGPQGPPGLDRR